MTHKIFVGGLNYETTESVLLEQFQKYGTVVNLRIVRDHDSGKSKGFAFITYATQESVLEALKFDGEKLDGRIIGVKVAFEKPRK